VECGSALANHIKVRKISFTGIVAVGRKIQVAAARSNLKSVTLDLGGKTPVIVFPDADIDLAVTDSSGFMRLGGQGCVLGTRIFAHEAVVDNISQSSKLSLSTTAQPWAQTHSTRKPYPALSITTVNEIQ
jgi:aldehyde dehydrogenase (NAD+)